MLETGRRSAISTSELGLYSDRGDRIYNRSRYGLIVRKLAIGVMVVTTVILVAIFMYDFTSVTGSSKINQETKHIYILQNALKKSPNLSKKSNSTILYETIINRKDNVFMEDRSDDENYGSFIQRNVTGDIMPAETRIVTASGPEMRAQNLHNFKQRKRVLKSVEDANENEEPESKQLFDNHAIVYRMKQRYKHPDLNDDVMEEAQPTPFHWEFKTPHPTSFKRPRYPQLMQYRYPHASRSIQDIIKYLTNNAEMPNRGIKFTGVYMNPKKYDLIPDMDEIMSSSDKSEEHETLPYPIKSAMYSNDPFYQYKPKHPADVNLLATSNVRFSPIGIHRYSPYYDSIYSRPLITYNKPIITEPQFENVDSANTLTKNRKPKPFSVMLDIYPITDTMEQNKKTTWTRPQGSTEDYDLRRPVQYRGPKFYASSPQPIPLVAVPSPTPISEEEEEERKQMILHLNLYPRKKNKLNRNDIIQRSELMEPEEQQEFAKKIISPLESITKHLTDHSAIEESKFVENQNSETTNFPITRYHEMSLNEKDEKVESLVLDNDPEIYSDLVNSGIVRDPIVPSNHKLNIDEDYANTEKYEINAQEMIATTEKDCANCDNTTMIDSLKINANESIDLSKDIGIEGS